MTFRSPSSPSKVSVRVHRVRGTNLGCNSVCCKLHISQRLLSETRTNEKRYVLTFSRRRFYATSFCLSRVTAQSSMETSFVSYDFFQIIVVAQLESKWRPKYGLSQLSLDTVLLELCLTSVSQGVESLLN